ncbi:class I adenylate-forming enzyme family protein [Amycolatopsis sp. H20-H5]|uniref:class I adenylate-forming enzyme family protein n=1 Tax=Amycolatopsis sp. H20-H5 TaxID=3046309 RepID=UPI002DB71077|nr:class I adenylate-forming enzyme family protein [Amycolatopsis sp. H20-H5]MEC3981061.1 class I adenylate-forming enzyme family protein [Amycolatopsis sp. H20-H5]
MAKICGIDSVRTLEEWEADAVRMADELRARGVEMSDRVLLKAENSPAYLTALLALMHLGASLVLIDYQDRAETTELLIAQARVKFCVTDRDTVLPETDAQCFSLYELQFAAAGRLATSADLTVKRWCDLPDGLLMFSSGSTGTPKAIVKTGASFLENLRRNLNQVGHVEEDVLVPLLPFSHQYGLSMVLIAWLTRCSLVVAPYRRLDHALQMAGLCGATVFDATPATYRSMLNIARRRPVLMRVLAEARMLCVGAAPLDPGLVDCYVDEVGHYLLDSYGSTELGNVAFATLDNPVACGRAVEGVHLIVVDDDGNEVPAGAVGEVMVLTPDVMAGYLDDDGELSPIDRGWFASGDFGRLTEDGSLHVLGRKRAVHRMGYTLYPDMIERRMGEAGCRAKIIAIPCERKGSQLVAFIEDDQDRGIEHWRTVAGSALPGYEVPDRMVVIDSFPLNRNGKPDNKRLEELAVSA